MSKKFKIWLVVLIILSVVGTYYFIAIPSGCIPCGENWQWFPPKLVEGSVQYKEMLGEQVIACNTMCVSMAPAKLMILGSTILLWTISIIGYIISWIFKKRKVVETPIPPLPNSTSRSEQSQNAEENS